MLVLEIVTLVFMCISWLELLRTCRNVRIMAFVMRKISLIGLSLYSRISSICDVGLACERGLACLFYDVCVQKKD
jgi:hypothetical protein